MRRGFLVHMVGKLRPPVKTTFAKEGERVVEQVTSAPQATWVVFTTRRGPEGRAVNQPLGPGSGSSKQLGLIVLLLLSHNYWNNYTFFAETL